MQQAYAQADQVVSLAQKQAQEIMDEATNDANEIRMGAIAYADRMLKAIEDLLAGSQNIFKTNFAQLSTSMQKTLDVVTANRAELAPAESYGENAAMEEAAPDSAENAPVSDGPVQ